MSTRAVRRGTATLLASVLALSAIVLAHRTPERDTPRTATALTANLADSVAPTGKVAQPGVAVAPAAATVAAGAASQGGTAETSTILPSRTAHTGSVRGPPGQAPA